MKEILKNVIYSYRLRSGVAEGRLVMNTKCLLWIACLLSGFSLPSLSFGNGFATDEQSAKATGMGAAFVAQSDDPSAVFHNPAGIVQLEGFQVSAGFSSLMPRITFQSSTEDPVLNATIGGRTDLRKHAFWVPNVYATYKINEYWSVGFGAFSNFGLSTDWPDDWPGRFSLGGTDAYLGTLSLNPVVAFRPVDWLSLSAGAVVQSLEIDLKNKISLFPLDTAEPEQTFRGETRAGGWNAGLLFWASDQIKFGMSYRSRIGHSIADGLFTTRGIPELLGGDVSTGANGSLELPAILSLGISLAPSLLTLEFDAKWTEWSRYQKLEINLDTGDTISYRKDWSNVWAYHVGAQYALKEFLDLRAGYIYDLTPLRVDTLDALLPSGNRWFLTAGLGIRHERWTVDAAYKYMDAENRSWNNESGDYDTLMASPSGRITGEFQDGHAHILSLNLSCHF